MPVEKIIGLGSGALPLHFPGHDVFIFAANVVSKGLRLLMLLSTNSHYMLFVGKNLMKSVTRLLKKPQFLI
jgi:hypothetical protein